MDASQFRRMALGMQDASEGAHMGHPDFRRAGRIFATLHGDLRCGMVKLTPEQQRDFLRRHPTAFTPESGAWGRQGCTRVLLAAADEDAVGEAMTMAWRNDAAAGARTQKASRKRTGR